MTFCVACHDVFTNDQREKRYARENPPSAADAIRVTPAAEINNVPRTQDAPDAEDSS